MKSKPQFQFTVVDAGGDHASVPTILRLRRFLKNALRGYGLKCVDCRELPAEPPQIAADAAGGVAEGK